MEITVITGILRIAKEGIFSGLNNLKVNTVLSDNYTELMIKWGQNDEIVSEMFF